VDYRDDRPRLYVFNKNLEAEFDPIEFPSGLGSDIDFYVLNDTLGELITFNNNFSKENAMSFITKTRLSKSEAKRFRIKYFILHFFKE